MTWGKIITGSTSKENCCRAKKRKLKLTKVKLNLTKNPKATSKYKETKIPLSKKKESMLTNKHGLALFIKVHRKKAK